MGRAPHDFPDWPYNKFENSHDTVMKNIQGQLNGVAHECPAPPNPEPDSEDIWDSPPNTPVDEFSSSGDGSSSWDQEPRI